MYYIYYTEALSFSKTIPEHIVTKLQFRYKSGSCSRSRTRIAVSTSSLLWYRHISKCCFSCSHKWQSVLPSHPFYVCPGSPCNTIVMDVHSTTCKPYATLPDMQHSHYAVNIKLSQLSVKFVGGTSFTH
jgi:hypothetical protein